MNNKIYRNLIILFFSYTFIVQASSAITSKSPTNNSVENISTLLFSPTLSTTSINEVLIDKIYGSSGLNLPTTEVTHIKQTYSYLEFLAKINTIATDPSLIKDKTFFLKIASSTKDSAAASKKMIASKEWSSITITNKEIELSSMWQLYLKTKIVDYYENQKDFLETITMVQNQILPYLSNIELNFYNNDFIKLRNFSELLRTTKIMQDRAFYNDLANCIDWQEKQPADLYKEIEAFKLTKFYLYTHDKNQSAKNKIATLSHPLQEQVTAYFMLTTIDASLQKKFNKKSLLSFLTQASSAAIAPQFFSYTSADFVCLDMILTLQQKLNSPPSTVKGLQQKTFNISDLVDLAKAQSLQSSPVTPITPQKTTPSPAINKQKSKDDQSVVIQTTATDKAFKKFGKSIKSGDEKLNKNIRHDADETGHALGVNKMIQTSDTMLADDAKATGQGIAGSGAEGYGAITGDKLASKWGRSENKAAAKDVDGAVKSLTNLGKEMAHSNLAQMTENTSKAIAFGTAGFGATMIGDIVYAQTGNASIKDWGSKQSNAAVKDIQKIGAEIDTAISGIALAIEDSYIAMTALVVGDFIGFITGDQQMGQGLTLAMNQVGDSVIAVGAACLTSINNLTVDEAVQVYRVSESAVEILDDAVLVMYGGLTGQKGVANRSVAMTTATTKTFMTNVVKAATQTLSCVISSATAVLMSVVKSMAAVTNSITTVLFDIVDELTFISFGLAELFGAPVNAAQERDKVDAKMEAHRAVINMVVSVVLSIALTAVTFGAAAPEAAAMVTGEVATDAVETGSDVINAVKTGDEVAETAETGGEVTETANSAGNAGKGAEAASDTTNVVKDSKEAITIGTVAAVAVANIGQAMNILFGAFSIMSGNNQDDAAIKLLAQEKESVINLWSFIENNKAVMTHSQNEFIDELHKKHQVEIENQSFGLQYYTNYLHSSVNNIQNQIAHALAQQYISLLTPNANGARVADIGATWGITTPFVYLYPSQGFLTTTLGRPNFPYAQEIAQAPLVAQKQSSVDAAKDALDTSQKEPLKLWFNQRAVTTINQPDKTPLDIEIQFRIIYNLATDFHVGLYLGGNYYDYNSENYLNKIKETGTIDLDDTYLAKMFVLMREGDAKTPSLGVYENEGKGWITQSPLGATSFNNASIYNMSAKLDKDQLTVAFWPQDKPSAKWSSTVTVTQSDQKTFGIIFSGAAIEWDVIKPVMPIAPNKAVRTKLSKQSESVRETAAQSARSALKNPDFKSINLTYLGKKYIIQGQYLYTTNDTKLVDKKGASVTDVVAFATFTSKNVTDVGVSPHPADVSKKPNAIISMINGNVYDSTGVIIGFKRDPWTSFMKKNGPFDANIIASIDSKQKACPQRPVVVNMPTISLDDISISATPSLGGFQFGLSSQAPKEIKSTNQSFDKRQTQAAAGAAVQVGGLVSIGSGGFSL